MENIDWKHLPFAYMKTDYNVRCYYREGKWGELGIILFGIYSHAYGSNLLCIMDRKLLKV